MEIQRNKNVLYLKPIMLSQNTITGNWKPINGNNSDFPLIALRKGITQLTIQRTIHVFLENFPVHFRKIAMHNSQ